MDSALQDLLKVLLPPIATILAVVANGFYFNHRLEKVKAELTSKVEEKKAELAAKLEEKKGDVAVAVDSRKDIEKRRREALYRLRNLSSIATRLAEKVFTANKLNEKSSAVEALLPNLTELWATTKSIKDESFNGDIDREDIRPYMSLHAHLVDFFFLLDNTRIGQADYIDKLAKAFEIIRGADVALTEHNRNRIAIEL